MKNRAAIAVFGTVLTSPAFASERDATAAERARVVAHLSALGYTAVRDVDVVGSRFEADARSPAGRDVDVILDMDTLAIVREERS